MPCSCRNHFQSRTTRSDAYLANRLMENRHVLVVGVDVRHATSTGERHGALDLLTAAGVKRGATIDADNGYDTQDFVAHTGDYAISQKVSNAPKQGFGWIKTIGGLCKLPMVGLAAVRGWMSWTFATYNLPKRHRYRELTLCPTAYAHEPAWRTACPCRSAR